MQDCKKVVEELNAKVEKYEQILNEYLAQNKGVVKITAGPIEDNGVTYFRGEDHGGQAVLLKYSKENRVFDKEAKIEIGVEVVTIETNIVGVLPVVLQTKKEPTAFKQIHWDQVGGLKSQLSEIRTAVESPLLNEHIYKEFGMSALKGILLWGPPGCGKTLIGKAIASTVLNNAEGDSDCFIYVKGAELLSPYVGAAEIAIGGLFKQARAYNKKTGKRAVIFIDEAEALLPARGSRFSSDVDATIVPTFLSEMDGLEDGGPLMVLSTNLPQNIDSAILRDGRIDLRIEIKRPTQEDAIDIFGIHLKKVKTESKVEELCQLGASELFSSMHKENVSGAMIETIVKKATQHAITRSIATGKKSGLCHEDLRKAIFHLN